MNAWTRSWTITRTSFSIVKKDKEMLWFPILSGFFSVLFAAGLIVPTFILGVADKLGAHRLVVGPAQVVVLFVTYFGLSFIATFFNVCVVFTTRVRLSGGDATFMDSIRFAFSRIHLIAGWSAVSATVGLLLRGLDAIAEKAGIVGKILLYVLRALLASAWAITTMFVIPSMVYRDIGPFDAIRDSAQTLKRAWGESLIRHFGVGLAAFVCVLPCIVLITVGIATAPYGLGFAAAGVVGILACAIFFGVLSTVFNTVLYHWATAGVVPEGFDGETLAGALRVRQGRFFGRA